MPTQAEALPWLCSQLRLAEGLRELVIDMDGQAAFAMPAGFAELGRLTQMDSLQLHYIAVDAPREQLSAALTPLTGLTRLHLGFDDDPFLLAEDMLAFSWEATACGLTGLQELHVTSRASRSYKMLKGVLSGALLKLANLRRLEVLGMQEGDDTDRNDELQLAALSALETVSLQLHTQRGHYPGLGPVQQVLLSRIVSLSLALRHDDNEAYDDTHLPAIIALALTELVLDDIKLAPDSEQLSWLPDLPKLRRLVLTDVSTGSSQLPQGVLACTGLTELVLDRFLISCSKQVHYSNKPEVRLRSFPADVAHLSQLVRISLSGNALSAVPPCLAAATALEVLDMGNNRLGHYTEESHGQQMQGLDVLDSLTRLRYVNFVGFEMVPADYCHFHMAHPGAKLVSDATKFGRICSTDAAPAALCQ